MATEWGRSGRPRALVVTTTLVLGVALSIGAFALLWSHFTSDRRERMEQVLEHHRLALEEQVGTQVLLLHALRSAGVGPMGGASASAVDPLRYFVPSLRLIGWIPWPPGGALATVVLYRADGDAEGAASRFDGLPQRDAVLRRACEEQRAAAAAAASPDEGARMWLFLVLPVPARPPAPVGADDPCEGMEGLLVGAFDADVLIPRAFAPLGRPPADLYVIEVAPDGTEQVIGVRPGDGAATGDGAAAAALRIPSAAEGLEGVVNLGGGAGGGVAWVLRLVPAPVSPWDPQAIGAWAALLLGLLATSALSVYLIREGRAMAMLSAESRARAAIARALRESEERFRLALRFSRIAVFSQDRELRYVWMYNPQLPVPADRFIGRTNAELFDPETARRLEAVKRPVLETGIGRREEVRLEIDGREQVLDVNVEPLVGEDGTVMGIICAAIDVTESCRIRQELAAAREEAERANEAKSRFLAAASHDLRQPFQAMGLFHHILMSRLTDPKQSEIAYKLGEALGAGNALLGALLDTSALEAGNIQPRMTSFAVGDVIDRLVLEMADQAAAKGLTMRGVRCGAPVVSDPVLLERMLRNLLVNALRYTSSGSILLGCRRRGDRLAIYVCDTGPGIPEEEIHRIFEDFYRVGTEQRDAARGLGLGLSIVRRMADILHHQVTVRSRVGRGTEFAILVPLAGGADARGPVSGGQNVAP